MEPLKMTGMQSVKPFYDSALAMGLLAEKGKAKHRSVTQIDWFLAGYIEGIRAERKRKAAKSGKGKTMDNNKGTAFIDDSVNMIFDNIVVPMHTWTRAEPGKRTI